MRADAKPKFFKPRPVPLTFKEKVTKELEDLQKRGIISPVQFSSWAGPVVPVLKKNGKKSDCVGVINLLSIRPHLSKLVLSPVLMNFSPTCREDVCFPN